MARLKFTKLLKPQTHAFDRSYFLLSIDPMRVLSVPGSLNVDSGLACIYIGDKHDLEKSSVRAIVERSKPTLLVYGHAEPVRVMRLEAR